MPGKVAIIANPKSGRDVRRLAARASNMTHEAKRDLVARVAVGLDAMGVDEIMILKEPYRVSSGAVEALPLRAAVRLLDVGVTHTAADTEAAVRAARAAGCDVIVSLGATAPTASSLAPGPRCRWCRCRPAPTTCSR